MARNGLVFFYDWSKPLSNLPPDDFKEMVLSMLEYSKNGGGVVPTFKSAEANISAQFFFPAIDRSMKNAENGAKGGKTTQNKGCASSGASSTITNTITNTKTNTKTNTYTCDVTSFPALEDVKAYNTTEKITSDAEAERFYNYYAARGWKINGSPVEDWKALLRTWASNKFSEREKGKDAPKEAQSFDTDDFFSHALERSYGKCNEPKDVKTD